MFEKILFPTDLSEVSQQALENCIPVLFEMGAKELIVLHVVDIIPEDIQAIEVLQKDASQKLDRIVEELKSKGINAEYMVCIGSPSPKIATESRCPSIEIVYKAACEMADLVVVSSKGKNIRRRMRIGSTARNIVRKSSVPILVLNYDWNEETDEIECLGDCQKLFESPLIALDFSPCSELVISAVRRFAEQIKRATLYHVVDYGDVDEMKENIRKAKEILNMYAKKLGIGDCIVDAGTAGKDIVIKAIELNSTLITIGKTGGGQLKEILLGSTADEVIKKSKRPVLVVPCK